MKHAVVWLSFVLMALAPIGCRKAEEYPPLSFHRFNLHGVPHEHLWECAEVYSGASVQEVLNIQQYARDHGHAEWAKKCRWYQQLTGCLAVKYFEPGTLPRWMTRDRHENPGRMLACMVHDNEEAGAEWFVKDDRGQMIPIWPSTHSAMLLNLGPDCPKGVEGDSEGLTAIEYMTGPWLKIFLETRWVDTFDGVHIEDGPFPGVPCWKVGETLIAPGPGMEPMTCKEYRAHIYEHYSMFITNFIGMLARNKVLTRCNGHFDHEVCGWEDSLLIEHAKLVPKYFLTCKLEHFGNWGGCPHDDFLRWTRILFGIEDRFGLAWLDDYSGWDVGCLECGVRDHWSPARMNDWQRRTLAAAVQADGMTFNVKCKDNQGRVIPFGPHALYKLGKPLGPSQVHRDGRGSVYYRRFKRDGQITTVVWNPQDHPNAGIPPRDGAWFTGKWPIYGEYKLLVIE